MVWQNHRKGLFSIKATYEFILIEYNKIMREAESSTQGTILTYSRDDLVNISHHDRDVMLHLEEVKGFHFQNKFEDNTKSVIKVKDQDESFKEGSQGIFGNIVESEKSDHHRKSAEGVAWACLRQPPKNCQTRHNDDPLPLFPIERPLSPAIEPPLTTTSRARPLFCDFGLSATELCPAIVSSDREPSIHCEPRVIRFPGGGTNVRRSQASSNFGPRFPSGGDCSRATTIVPQFRALDDQALFSLDLDLRPKAAIAGDPRPATCRDQPSFAAAPR
ncbi:keratin [Striga asiatica]|uniref:Keratin n=1 Tax=Striga asiatica TaxID=4170 RepID=A0A5A7QRP9_STRAF|nr:keratin [Striga asiatica]